MGILNKLLGKKDKNPEPKEEQNLNQKVMGNEKATKAKQNKKPKEKVKSKPKAVTKPKAKANKPAPAPAYPDVDVTVLRGRQDLIPRKYIEQRLNAWSTQNEKLQFLWDLGYRKVSRDIFREIEFSETAPVALSSIGANYGQFRLHKELNEQDFNLIKIEQEKSAKAGE